MPFDRAFDSEHSDINVISVLQYLAEMIFSDFLTTYIFRQNSNLAERPTLRHHKYQTTQPELSKLLFLYSVYI